jgi:hypothetical protein
MPTPRTILWIERLTWVYIFGGLLLAVLGMFARRQNGTTGWVLIAIGVVLTVVGVVLIGVRSRIKNPP